MSEPGSDGQASPPVAAVDLGTNTALLLVARRASGGALDILAERCATPRLGAGLVRTGALDPGACERALAVLREFAHEIGRHGVAAGRVRAVGTACLRRARDGAEFARRAARESGIEIEILSEEEEARLGELGLQLAGAGPESLVVDVGGGSTEIACRALSLRRSIPIGAVLLTESWIDPLRFEPERWAALRAAARGAADALPSGVARGRPTWAIGGTAVHLGCVHTGLPRFDPGAIEGHVVPAGYAAELAERLAPLSRAQRLAFPIEPERADILPAGLAALAAVLERLGARSIRVSGFGLRHGVVRELLGG